MAGQTAQKLSDVFFAIPAGQFARHLPSPCYFATPCPAFYLNFHPRFPLFLSRATIYNIFPRLPPLLPANPLVSRNNNAPRVTKIFRFRATGNGSCVRAPFFVFWNNAVTVLGSSTSLCYSLCVTESVKNAAKSVILRVLIYRNTRCLFIFHDTLSCFCGFGRWTRVVPFLELHYFIFVKRFRTISFSKRWPEERGEKVQPILNLTIPLFSRPSWIVTSIMRARVHSPVFFVRTWRSGVTRAIDRENYATPGTLVSVKSSERAAPWHGWKNFEGHAHFTKFHGSIVQTFPPAPTIGRRKRKLAQPCIIFPGGY